MDMYYMILELRTNHVVSLFYNRFLFLPVWAVTSGQEGYFAVKNNSPPMWNDSQTAVTTGTIVAQSCLP